MDKAPDISTERRTTPRTARGTALFRPYFVQRGQGPHLGSFAYATDLQGDTFRSNIDVSDAGVQLSDTGGHERFGINVRWNVEDVGYLYLTADGGGEGYALPPDGETKTFNLNLELARSRVLRNRQRHHTFSEDGWTPSHEIGAWTELAESYFEQAQRTSGDEERRATVAQKALRFALMASEAMEVAYAEHQIRQQSPRADFFFGTDARPLFIMDNRLFLERFLELFNYATITHYSADQTPGLSGFEPVEGDLYFASRDFLLDRLHAHDITVEARPVFWPHEFVTPDWMRRKTFDELKRYVERHTRKVVGHYGDRIHTWEIVNELHDWANEVEMTPEQTIEITKLACEVAKDTAPSVGRLINNCCPFAEYVQRGKWTTRPAKYPQRTPWQFMQQLVEAEVDFTVTGVQMYFPYRDLQDIVLLVERYEQFGWPVQLTEVGAPSIPTADSNRAERPAGSEREPFAWRRSWDEELQADWAEAIFKLFYSKPWVRGVNWYDFVDPHVFLAKGGLLRSVAGERKAAFHRLQKWQQQVTQEDHA